MYHIIIHWVIKISKYIPQIVDPQPLRFSLRCQELVSKQGEHAIRFYVLFLLGFMSGLEAGSGSRLGLNRSLLEIQCFGAGLPIIIETLDAVYRQFCMVLLRIL